MPTEIVATDVNYYQPNEANPLIVNPDTGTSKEAADNSVFDRTIPANLKTKIEPGTGYSTELVCKVHNDYRMGMFVQPALYFHLESKNEVEPGEILAFQVQGINVFGTANGPDRIGTILVQHDVGQDMRDNDGNGDILDSSLPAWNQTATQGRPDITMSEEPSNTYVLYPPPSDSFQPSLYSPSESKPTLSYTIQAEDESKTIVPGQEQDLKLVAKNANPDSVKVAAFAVYVQASHEDSKEWQPGEKALCKKSDIGRIELSGPVEHDRGDFLCSMEEPPDSQYLEEDIKDKEGWTFLGVFKSQTENGDDGHKYEKLATGDTLSFSLKKVVVSETSGEGAIKVVEKSWPDDEGEVRKSIADGVFTKFGGGFFFDYLHTIEPEVEEGNAARLAWSAAHVKEYELFVDPEKDNPASPGSDAQYWDTGRLTDSVGYLLQATSKEDLVHSQQVVAIVHHPTSTFHNVTARHSLVLKDTNYASPINHECDSNNSSSTSWDVLTPYHADDHEGDRYAVVGISKFIGTDKEANARVELQMSGMTVGTVYADPERCNPVSLRVPPGKTLSARLVHDTLKRTVQVSVSAMVTKPMILPTP
ncbi:hypothetical protein [Streptomyces wuyuanensis]|uniref:hypothetical protein n=1 Tax=Streptomyces wuyuanensis TaxID=1196353 RepID=UPI00342B54E0